MHTLSIIQLLLMIDEVFPPIEHPETGVRVKSHMSLAREVAGQGDGVWVQFDFWVDHEGDRFPLQTFSDGDEITKQTLLDIRAQGIALRQNQKPKTHREYVDALPADRKARVEALGAALIAEEARRREQLERIQPYVSKIELSKLEDAPQEELDLLMKEIDAYEQLGSKED